MSLILGTLEIDKTVTVKATFIDTKKVKADTQALKWSNAVLIVFQDSLCHIKVTFEKK